MINKLTGINEPESTARYGCVFCKTGREESVVVSLEAQNRGLKAIPCIADQTQKCSGNKEYSTTNHHARLCILSNKVGRLARPPVYSGFYPAVRPLSEELGALGIGRVVR